MGGRRLGPVTLHYTYAERERENKDNFSGPIRGQAALLPPIAAGPLLALADGVDIATARLDTEQNSHTLGLRYDFDAAYSLKLEYQAIHDSRNHLSNQLFSVAVDFIFLGGDDDKQTCYCHRPYCGKHLLSGGTFARLAGYCQS